MKKQKYKLAKSNGHYNRNTYQRRVHLFDTIYKTKIGNLWYAVLTGVLGLLGFQFYNYRYAFWAVAALCLVTLARREGKFIGFLEGHEQGYEDRVSDDRNLTDLEAAEFSQMEDESTI